MLLYLESFGNPRKFGRIARRVARKKPILAVKSGRSAAGARAASSHTGALLASSDVTVDSLFEQAGVIRTDTLAELFDVAHAARKPAHTVRQARGNRDQRRRAGDHVRGRVRVPRSRGRSIGRRRESRACHVPSAGSRAHESRGHDRDRAGRALPTCRERGGSPSGCRRDHRDLHPAAAHRVGRGCGRHPGGHRRDRRTGPGACRVHDRRGRPRRPELRRGNRARVRVSRRCRSGACASG